MKMKTIYKNLRDAVNVLRGEFVVSNTYISKGEKSKINRLSFHLSKLEYEDHIKPKVSRREEIMKIEINQWPGLSGSVVERQSVNQKVMV